MKQNLQFEIPFVFYKAFKLAIDGVNKHNNGKLLIESEVKQTPRMYVFEVSSMNVIDFYFLGIKYSLLKG